MFTRPGFKHPFPATSTNFYILFNMGVLQIFGPGARQCPLPTGIFPTSSHLAALSEGRPPLLCPLPHSANARQIRKTGILFEKDYADSIVLFPKVNHFETSFGSFSAKKPDQRSGTKSMDIQRCRRTDDLFRKETSKAIDILLHPSQEPAADQPHNTADGIGA